MANREVISASAKSYDGHARISLILYTETPDENGDTGVRYYLTPGAARELAISLCNSGFADPFEAQGIIAAARAEAKHGELC